MRQTKKEPDFKQYFIINNSTFRKYIIDRVPVALLILDHTGTVIYGNRFFSRLSGIPEPLITGKKFNIYPAITDNDGLCRVDSTTVKTPAAIINSMVCDGGKKVILKWETSEIQRPDNEKKCTLCIGRDITHEKELEIKLRRARKTIEEWSKTFFEKNSIPQLLIMDGKIIDCNTKALKLLGMNSKKKLIGLAPADISPERQSDGLLSRDKADFVINRAIIDGFIEFEWVHRKKNGDDLHVMVSLSAHEIEGKIIIHAVWTDITKRKKTEQALLESENRFRAIFMGSNDAMLLFDQIRIFDCNPKAIEMFGYQNRGDMLKQTGFNICPRLQADGQTTEEVIIEHIMKALNNGYDCFELLFKRAGGEVFPAEVMLSTFNLDGKKVRQAAIRDITQKKQAEFALLRSEERYRNLADMAFEGILIHDNGTALDVNLTFCKMFGYDRDELIGKNVIDMIIHRDYHALAYRKVDAQDDNTYEALSLKKGGTPLWVEIFGKPYIHDGKIIRVVATRDISDRKMIENILRKSEEKFRRITESSLNELIITDEKGVIRFVSPSITRYTGFRPSEMVGKQIETFFPENMAAKVRRHLDDAIEGKAVGHFESNILRVDGSLASIEASIVMTAGTNGKRELEIYMRDISEQKQLQQEIIRLSEAERRKMGQNLHDGLGQVLTGISIMIGTVARKIKLNKSVTYDEMIRIAQKVEEAIDTTRLTARGLYPVTLEKGGLISALREMAITVESSYGTRCRVFNQGKDTAPDVHTSYQLYYIVQEAINNTIRHGKAKKIDIDIVIKKKLIRFAIANDITVKSRKKKSDGMGLRIMEYRAEMIGGTFSVKPGSRRFRIGVEIQYK